jgi:hypothetical protein
MFMIKLREISCQFVEFKARHPKKEQKCRVNPGRIYTYVAEQIHRNNAVCSYNPRLIHELL